MVGPSFWAKAKRSTPPKEAARSMVTGTTYRYVGGRAVPDSPPPESQVPVSRVTQAFAAGVNLGQPSRPNRWGYGSAGSGERVVLTPGAGPVPGSPGVGPTRRGSPELRVLSPQAVPAFVAPVQTPKPRREQCWHCKVVNPDHAGPDCPEHPDRVAARLLAAATGETGTNPNEGLGPEDWLYVVPGPGFGNHQKGETAVAPAGLYVGQKSLKRAFYPGVGFGNIPHGSVVKHLSFKRAIDHWAECHLQARQVTTVYR